MSDLNGTEANQPGLSANTADHSTTHQPVTTKDMAADIEQSNGHSLQDKTEAEVLPLENKENGSLEVDEKPIEPIVEDKMDTTEDPKDSEPAKQPTAEASTGDKRVRDEDDVEHKPTDTVQETSEAAAVSETTTTTDAAAAATATATADASTNEPITKEIKKQKTDADAITDTAGALETTPSADTTAPITTETGATEESTPKKKAGRPKKDDTKFPSVTDEIKDAVETVSRRTRSRGSA